jgi:signal transduction histidine kinase/CheY-like chemotaxis protein
MSNFRLLRYFSATSGVAILLVTAALSWSYHRKEVDDQVSGAEARNTMMAQAFANAIWPQYAEHLMQPFTDALALNASARTAQLEASIRGMSRRVPVTKIKIYNRQGIAMYSSVRAEIGEDKSANPAFRAALDGRTVSELTHRGSMSVSEGHIENVDVVSSYIPIDGDDDGRAEAVFELYSDVTDAMAMVTRQTRSLVAGLVLVFAALYVILVLIVRRADTILRRQYRELKDNESALRRSEEAAAAANRAKTEFLSSMSHELRTPMNAILGFAQLFESEPGTPLSQNQQSFIHEILKAGRHLLELINEVLDLARIEAGKLSLSVEPVSIASVLRECLPLVQNMASERGIVVSLPPLESEARVMADYMRLKQSLLNLLTNAVKYNRPAGRVDVAVTAPQPGHYRISVSDNGPGIPESRKAELFSPFNRLGLDAAVEGTGIGLAISRRLVEAMGGEIGFESRWQQGTTFWIDLPQAPQAEKPVMPRELVAPTAPEMLPSQARTMLYIEDNPANVLLMEQIARRMSLGFLSAHTAEIGIVLAASAAPDVIVMDINLPNMNGYEALARLRADRLTASIPVIALTANAMERDVARGLEAGFASYSIKPLRVDEMVRTLESALEAA